MKTFIRLCRVIIRGNKGFTAGLFLMSVLSFAIAFLGANFGASAGDTVDGFISGSGVPQAVYLTEPVPLELGDEIRKIDGVNCVSPGFMADTHITTNDKTVFSVRLFLWDDASPYRQTVYETAAGEITGAKVAVSSEFADYNGIHAGDRIMLNTPLGDVGVTVEATVSNPETMNCIKDEMSAYESYQFAYLYMDAETFNAVFPTGGTANRWLIFFDKSLTEAEQKDRMGTIRELFGPSLSSETFTEKSEALRTIRDDMATMGVISSFVPAVIFLISLGFGFIFIRIIIEKEKKTIGLLRALGYGMDEIVLLFVCYTVLINLPALLCGVCIGYRLLTACVGLLAASSGIAETVITVRFPLTVLMTAAVFAIGAVSALLSARTIANIDPSTAYGGNAAAETEPPGFLRSLRVNEFLKISLASICRDLKRQIIAALCVAACVVSICVGLEGVLTIGYPIDAVYGGRYRYDLMVRSVDDTFCEQMRDTVDGIDRAEPFTYFSSELFGENVRVATLTEDAELVVLFDASGNRLYPGDGVIIDEMRAKLNQINVGDTVELGGTPLPVTGIAREILYPVQFVSPETAESMGYPETGGVMLRLREDCDAKAVENAIAEIDGAAYLTRFASQKEDINDGFQAMRAVMFVFAVLAFGIGSLLVFNMTIIDFNESRKKYAVLRALGTPISKLCVISFIQNLSRVLTGILVALPLCRVLVSVLLELLSSASQQYVTVGYSGCLLVSCLVPLAYVLIGTGVSAYRIKTLAFCSELNETE